MKLHNIIKIIKIVQNTAKNTCPSGINCSFCARNNEDAIKLKKEGKSNEEISKILKIS